MELTKEYFDEQLALHFKLFEDRFEAKIDKKLDALETRITKAYQEFTVEAIEAHQTWVVAHFKDWIMPYEIRLSRIEFDKSS